MYEYPIYRISSCIPNAFIVSRMLYSLGQSVRFLISFGDRLAGSVTSLSSVYSLREKCHSVRSSYRVRFKCEKRSWWRYYCSSGSSVLRISCCSRARFQAISTNIDHISVIVCSSRAVFAYAMQAAKAYLETGYFWIYLRDIAGNLSI